ncbi:GNAT family N-acetyltransferase [Pandoraea terrae]|nr:GNAT family N-acetyltransferase [Pandoraea terrae]
MCKRFDELEPALLYRVLEARSAVFVVEQDCVYQDIDGRDLQCLHLIAQARDAQGELRIVAYLRLLPPGLAYEEASLGRVLSTAPYRGTGIGRELIARALSEIEAHWPGAAVRISAQAYLERFYGAYGFVTQFGPYDEDGIPHLDMLRAASSEPR